MFQYICRLCSRNRRTIKAATGVALTLWFALISNTSLAQTYPTYTDLHDFGGTVINAGGTSGPDGAEPDSSVTLDSEGNRYGTTITGGPNDTSLSVLGGTLWEVTKNGAYKDLHDFGGTVVNANGTSGPDGYAPAAGVAFDSEGNMYGTTTSGGPNAGGMVWEITKAGVYKDLHDFGGAVVNANGKSGPDGNNPEAGITFDSGGNLYGTTSVLGPSFGGNIWEITKAGAYKDLHDFGGAVVNSNGKTGTDGSFPYSPVTFDPAGNTYGTTEAGGLNQSGIIWELTKAGLYKNLHDFGGTVVNASGKSGVDGKFPLAGVTLDATGNLYGAADEGGPGFGMIWEFTVGEVYKDLHDFGGTVVNANGNKGSDGKYPVAGVTFDLQGNLYGTASEGGPNGPSGGAGDGLIYEITNAGVYKDLHDFGGSVTLANGTRGTDCVSPEGGVAFDSVGNMYGTTSSGGPNGYSGGAIGDGNVWKLSVLATPLILESVSLAPSTVIGGTFATGTVTLSTTAPTGGKVVTLSSSSPDATTPSSITVPAGADTAIFTVKTPPIATNVTAIITAKLGTVTKTATLKVEAAQFTGFTVSPDTFKGSATTAVTGKLTLNGPPPAAGATITLKSSDPTAVSVPATAFIHSGNLSTTFPIKHSAVKTSELVTVTATYGATTRTFRVEVTP